MTMHPAAAALGANSADTSAPAENSPMSAREKSKLSSSATAMLLPRNFTLRPNERLLASGCNSDTGNWRSSRMLIMLSPTRPVAPTTATLKLLLIAYPFLPILWEGAGAHVPRYPAPRTPRPRFGPAGADSDPSARSPAWLRRSAWPAAPHMGRAGLLSRLPLDCRPDR